MRAWRIAACAARLAMAAALMLPAAGSAVAELQPSADADILEGAEARSTPRGNLPILLISSESTPITRYYGEILRAEGLPLFSSADARAFTAALLARFHLVILAEVELSAEQVKLLEAWVWDGGLLIAMRPGPGLGPLLGLVASGTPVKDGYLLADKSSAAGRGIAASTLQIHGEADRYEPRGASVIAQLYSDATSALPNPAVTLRSVGPNGGQAAAFVYALAESVVLTRQGNPEWAGQERDGYPAIRASELFFPDFVDLDKVSIPQADEQQRLFANLIMTMMQTKHPLPRFWYLPNAKKAAIVMASDDHRTGTGKPRPKLLSWIAGHEHPDDDDRRPGTVRFFETLIAESPPGCSVQHWECLRATSYLVNGTPVSEAQALLYQAQGFELGVHVDTGCANREPERLRKIFKRQLLSFVSTYPGLPAQATHRLHCIVWLGWTEGAEIAREHGIRLDLNYYYWPPTWVRNRPGFFTGSGFPMRLVDRTGRLIDVYQAVTHLSNETGLTVPAGIEAMLDRALGREEFFGTFGTHYDFTDRFSEHLLRAAKARDVPLISAQQLLTWLDGRNGSFFSNIAWDGTTLSFDVTVSSSAVGVHGMLPGSTASGHLASISCGAGPVEYFIRTVKGLDYAFFPARSGRCAARYGDIL
jgi:hypothetical protein